MNEVDLVVVGADAITSEGNIINKIGTSVVALAAKEARTPFYVACELLKFDLATIHGDYETIEERSRWFSERDLRYHLTDYLYQVDTVHAESLDNWSIIPAEHVAKSSLRDRYVLEEIYGTHNK